MTVDNKGTADGSRCPVTNFDFTIERPVFSYFSMYDEMREESPIYHSELGEGFWIVSRYELAAEILKNTEVFSSSSFDVLDPDPELLMIPLGVDPPDHREYRRILNPWFSKSFVHGYKDRWRDIAGRQVDAFLAAGHCDFMSDFAISYSTETFLGLLGVPLKDVPEFPGWVETFFAERLSKEHGNRAIEATDRIGEYFKDVIADRHSSPRDTRTDFFSYLLTAHPFGRPMTDDEVLSICVLITLAGLDATRASLGWLFLYIAMHPELRHELATHLERIPDAIEESLRLHTVVIQDARKVTRDIDFYGCPMRTGDMVQVLVAAGNRDPRAFDHPLEFDMDRRSINPSIGFGAGPHKCLGAPLARLTMTLAVEEFLARIPDFEVDLHQPLTERGVQVSLTSLPLKWPTGSPAECPTRDAAEGVMNRIRAEQPSLDRADRFYIDGEWVKPAVPAFFDVIEPTTEELYFRAAAAGPADMNRAIAAARKAFDEGPWPRMGHQERAYFVRAIGELLAERREESANQWTCETGILNSTSRAAADDFGGIYTYYADLAADYAFLEHHATTAGGKVGLLVREPVGVVGVIIPWNGPMPTIAWKAAPALLAGCTMVIKSAPEAPASSYLLAEICDAAGLPPGVVNFVTAAREVSEQLVRDPRIDKITFTGSTAAGRRIASLCGDRIARVTLELCGKSAAVVLDDYDVAQAAETISQSARFLTGQVCASLTRIIVGRQRHDEFVDALSASFSAVRLGDPFDASTDMGPLAMRRQMDRVLGYLEKGRACGAELVTGGHRAEQFERGYFVEPTVFGRVDNTSVIAQEEIFGPVLSVIPADDEAHAIRLANETIYGLNATVFSDDVDHALQAARQIRSGTVGHNAFRSDLGIAFGGFKQSGIGREGGREGLRPYLETKTIILEDEPT